LIAASEVYFADSGDVSISVSQEAALQMTDTPSGGPQNLRSLFGENLFASKATHAIAWHARTNAAALAVLTL
jgi:hypothetical protein